MKSMTMNAAAPRRARLLAAGVVLAAAAVVLSVPTHAQSAISGPVDGILCDTDASDSFTLEARTGYMQTPDGNSIFMWSYTRSGRGFQLPGPTLCVTAGSPVTVVLHNTLPEATSIVFSGQDNIAADGQPARPQFDGTGTMTSLVQEAAATNGSVTYTFTASTPGTYLYSTGSDVAKQRDMGLYGALVVRAASVPGPGVGQANSDASSTYSASHEYLYVLSQIDPALHLAVERNRSFDYTKTIGRYFLINGRSMPDTLAPNNAAWMPNQPYGSLIHITSYDAVRNPNPALIRYVNAGPVNYPFHPHGNNQVVITRDGTAVHTAAGSDASYEKFLIDVGPGQSVDTLDKWVSEYDPDAQDESTGGACSRVVTTTNCASVPSDIQLPQLQDQIVGPGTETWFSENPYLGAPGGQGEIPTGMIQNNECGEYYHVAHSHALEQATNYGASFGGMMTLIRIDPPTCTP
jgi:FtsP/CotA-like multicopper oxidase with cupredoxin domain